MIKFSLFSRVMPVVALMAVPGVAHAGTATASGNANFNVINQCSVTGATVNLGTYTSSQTWGDVAANLGLMDYGPAYTAGGRGQAYLTWGSVTCDNGTPYTLSIKGTSTQQYSPGGIRFAWQNAQGANYTAVFDVYVKSIGGTAVADSVAGAAGAGARANVTPAAGIGTGAAQTVLGSAVYSYDASMSQLFDTVPEGSLSDSLTYTLNF